MTTSRDFNSISPSAKGLLFLKSLTNIPFALKAATLMHAPEPYTPDFDAKEPFFWARVLHFEDRYWSINQLLEDTGIHNILELSSGFSFRGLATANQPGYHYIDTDLPDLIATKQGFVKALQATPVAENSSLEILPLNALDAASFEATVNKFPAGPLAIVNEGLLMYLDLEEKKQLCQIIRTILEKRGGYWITADIYIKEDQDFRKKIIRSDALMEFFDKHQIEEKKFDSFDAAKTFFAAQGFEIDKVAVRDNSKLSTLPYLLKTLQPEQLEKLKQRSTTRETWRLKVKQS
ncbi:class I SAM-dependent methyltransferase [Chitinophaga sp. Hz27]|uniref:class I SAM-dependent methyltransferase n=1 Tax=Chitinophaga sp. Hz27 TaxID=3347169 RepID=UPI0035DA6315